MANYVTSSDFLVPSAYVKSSEQAAFPASNVNLYTLPYRPWKANSAISSGSHWVGIDLGASLLPEAVVVENINVASAKIESASDAAFTTDVQDSGTLTISRDFDSRRKYYLAVPGGWTARRYWRVRSLDIATQDGSAYFSVGSLVAFLSVDEWERNLGEEWGETALRETIRSKPQGGGPVVETGNPYARIRMSQQKTIVELNDTLSDLLELGEARPFMLYKNQGDPAQVYIGRIVGSVERTFAEPGTLRVQQLTFEACVAG